MIGCNFFENDLNINCTESIENKYDETKDIKSFYIIKNFIKGDLLSSSQRVINLDMKTDVVIRKQGPPVCHSITSQMLIKINVYQLFRELHN